MKQSLSFQEFKIMSQRVASSFGIVADLAMILETYYGQDPMPYILQTECVKLWIDRYYIAYQLGYEDVVYLYLSRVHIDEETESYEELNQYNRTSTMPNEIREQFDIALKYMDQHRTCVWIAQHRNVFNSRCA